MSHAVRLHMCQVYVCTAQDVVLCVGQASLPVSCCGCFVVGALRRVSHGRSAAFPLCPTQWRSREDGRGGGGLEKRRSCVQPCGVTRASLVRARAARALSEAAESRRAVAHVPGVRVYCTGCGAVREGKRLFLCRVAVVLWLGRCGSLTRKVGCLPTLRGGPHAVAAPATWTDLLGARAERVPDCSSYLSRIPWSAADGRLSIHPRDSVDRAAWAEAPSDARLHALLNASAASESTTAGGLEALSKLRWSREV